MNCKKNDSILTPIFYLAEKKKAKKQFPVKSFMDLPHFG